MQQPEEPLNEWPASSESHQPRHGLAQAQQPWIVKLVSHADGARAMERKRFLLNAQMVR